MNYSKEVINSYINELSDTKSRFFSSLYDSLIESDKGEEFSFIIAKSIVENNLHEEEDGKTVSFTDENFEEIITVAPKQIKDFSKISGNLINTLEAQLPSSGGYNCPIIDESYQISESDFDSETKRAKVTLIQAGWSKNMNFYSPTILEQLVPFIKAQPKIFINHEEIGRFGLGLDRWGATVETVNFVRDGKKSRIEAILNFEGALQGEKMMNAVIHQPKEVGLSINTIAQVSQGTREGKTGRIIEKWVRYHSTDFVHGPSAGGKVQAVFASEMDEELSLMATLIESLQGLSDRFEVSKERDNFFTLMFLLERLIVETSRTSDVSDKDKKEHINQLVNEFADKLGTIDLNRAFPPFNEIGEAKNEEATDMEGVAKITLAVLEQENPSLVQAITDRAVEALESGRAVIEMKEDLTVTKESLTKVEGELEQTSNKLKETEGKLEVSEKAKADAEVKLAKFEETTAREEKTEMITAAINDSKYPGGAEKYPEFYKEQLFEMETEDDIKEAIEALANLALSDSGKVTANGETTSETETDSKESVIGNNENASTLLQSK